MNKTKVSNDFNWSFWILCSIVIGYISIILLLPATAFADNNMKKDVEAFNTKYGPGIDIAVFGKALPSGALDEWNRAIIALREARKTLQKMLKKLGSKDEIPEYVILLANKLNELERNLKRVARYLQRIAGGTAAMLNDLVKEIDVLHEKFMDLNDKLTKMLILLTNKKDKDEGWSFGVTAYGSAEWAITKEDIMPIGGLGLTINWRKEVLSFDMMLGAGIASIEGAALSWTFISSVQFLLNPKFSLGPAMILSQDLGSMEGVDRWVWEVGLKLHTNAYGLGLWAIPAVGIHGERGYGVGSPTYSPNIGITLGVDYLFIK